VDALRFADVVTGSLTKWISGEGDVMAGMATVRTASPVANALRESLAADAADSAPLYIGDGEILLSNLKSYAKRMKTVNAHGSALAAWLAEHPAVAEVWHPSMKNCASYEAVMRKGGGFGGLLSIVLKNPKKTPKVYDALRLSKGPSFGTYFTLVCPSTLLAPLPRTGMGGSLRRLREPAADLLRTGADRHAHGGIRRGAGARVNHFITARETPSRPAVWRSFSRGNPSTPRGSPARARPSSYRHRVGRSAAAKAR